MLSFKLPIFRTDILSSHYSAMCEAIPSARVRRHTSTDFTVIWWQVGASPFRLFSSVIAATFQNVRQKQTRFEQRGAAANSPAMRAACGISMIDKPQSYLYDNRIIEHQSIQRSGACSATIPGSPTYCGVEEGGYVLIDSTESDSRPRVEPIHRRNGVTSAERYLKRLCDHSFLSLWSYAGVYRDQWLMELGQQMAHSPISVYKGEAIQVLLPVLATWIIRSKTGPSRRSKIDILVCKHRRVGVQSDVVTSMLERRYS
jgi:hypothetical protein